MLLYLSFLSFSTKFEPLVGFVRLATGLVDGGELEGDLNDGIALLAQLFLLPARQQPLQHFHKQLLRLQGQRFKRVDRTVLPSQI